LDDLRRVGKRFDEELGDVSTLRFAPGNDPAGDCRVVTALQFDDEKTARAFATSEGVGGYLPVDTGRHLSFNWDALIEGRIGHHDEMNPLNFPSNAKLRRTFSPESCPRTRDITSRTVFIANNPDWTDEQIEERIAACRRAEQSL
jgi:hypothetical protein